MKVGLTLCWLSGEMQSYFITQPTLITIGLGSGYSVICLYTCVILLVQWSKPKRSKWGIHVSGFPLTCPDKIPWLSLTFWGEFSLTFPDSLTVVYIQMKQFEDNGSLCTRTINLMAYVENKERARRQVGLWWYAKICRAERGEKIPAVDTFSLMRKVWK